MVNFNRNPQRARPEFSVGTIALLFAIGLAAGAPQAANAKTFRNAYVSFDLPERWNCTLEQTEWVCRTNEPGLAEALIVLTAKEVGPQDALPGYETHLKQPRTIVTRTGTSLQSTVYKVEQSKVNDHVWIDAMHFSSEVSNYYTRYLATTKDRIAVLVTFSAHKDHYSKYSSEFFRAIASLRVIATRSTMNPGSSGGDYAPGGTMGGNTDPYTMVDAPAGPDLGNPLSGDSNMMSTLFGLALMLGAIGFYVLTKQKKKQKK